MAVSNKEIEEIQTSLNEKLHAFRVQEREIRVKYDSLENLKFVGRQVEDKPAEYGTEVDSEDPTKTIKVLRRKATMKTVYDVAPKSTDDPTVDLDEKVRTKVFNQIKASI